MKIKSVLRSVLLAMLVVLLSGMLIPDNPIIPVQDATERDWHRKTFWYEPWGSSGVHKGIDIFARPDTPVIAPTNLWVLYTGVWQKGGKVIVALGPKWRIHYFAHLSQFEVELPIFLQPGEPLGLLGDTGNARGKQAHLHYSIISLLPRPWKMDLSTQGYKKAFYLDPGKYLTD